MTQLSTREPGTREVTHEVSVDAPAAAVYQLIADIENWPLIFPPTVHVAKIESTGRQELIRIWATANGEAKNWTSRRSLYPAQLRIEFGGAREIETADIEDQFAAYSEAADFPATRWTDAYLAAFAQGTGCRLVSFDADFHRFPGLDFLHLQPA